MPEIQIEDYVAPVAAPHEYAPIVEKLLSAGPDKVATAKFKTEEEARTFIREMQVAARQAGKSALKRALAKTEDGKEFYASVSVRDKITRARKTATEK